MCVAAPEMSASQVLSAFHRDAPYLFLGAALMLAAFEFASYSSAVHKLAAGDRLVMYMDGILEASNREGDFFSHDALCDLVAKTRERSPVMAVDSMISSVGKWSVKQEDGLTVLVCDCGHT